MKKSFFWYALLILTILLFLSPDAALAAPGGKIVSAAFKSTWGKILLLILCIIFSPIIAYVLLKEHFAEKRTLKHLKQLAAVDANFNWLRLKDRVTDCYHRVHAAWRQEDMSEASDWMTSWYWQNQQLAFLNQWERDGLVNHCRVKSIGKIRPLYLSYESDESGTSNGSRVVISITANMEDYLAERTTGKIVEGAKGYEDSEHVWTFELREGKWVVANIEEGSMSLSYAKLKSEVPVVFPAREAQQTAT
jgi:hypothetical protein